MPAKKSAPTTKQERDLQAAENARATIETEREKLRKKLKSLEHAKKAGYLSKSQEERYRKARRGVFKRRRKSAASS